MSPGRYVRTTIKDNGSGIPHKALPKVFDPFFTTRQKASGLGLSVTYSIIKKHQGHIGIDSVEGAGTCVHVYLPASREEPAGRTDEALCKGSGRILVMDDEELVRDVAAEMFKVLGYDADFAVGGQRGRRAVRRGPLRGQAVSTSLYSTLPSPAAWAAGRRCRSSSRSSPASGR